MHVILRAKNELDQAKPGLGATSIIFWDSRYR
jgi:hypothetical protein